MFTRHHQGRRSHSFALPLAVASRPLGAFRLFFDRLIKALVGFGAGEGDRAAEAGAAADAAEDEEVEEVHPAEDEEDEAHLAPAASRLA